MNYSISLNQLNHLAAQALLKQPKVSLAEMKQQVAQLKQMSSLKMNKKSS